MIQHIIITISSYENNTINYSSDTSRWFLPEVLLSLYIQLH